MIPAGKGRQSRIGAMEGRKGDFDMLRQFLKDESGATAIEYGLIAALIAVAIIGGARALGTNIGDTFNNVSNAVK